MISLDFIKDYIQGLNRKEVLRIFGIYFLGFTILVGLLLYRHFNLIADMKQKMKALNKARQDVQVILTEYGHIKSKQHDVDQLLAKDKGFYIQKYYQDTVANAHIANQTASNLNSQTWPNGYIEESLQINLLQITMQQMCEFLQALQSNQRVFVKNLDITKANTDKKINVNMTIATLKPVADKTSK